MGVCVCALAPRIARTEADATAVPAVTPAPPARGEAPRISRPGFTPSWDLDGLYVWLGPIGAASHIDARWDSTFGADLSIVRVRERAPLAAIGATAGASLWTARDGGRVWIDVVAGTRLGGRMYGVTAGPVLELGELAHPRLGGSVGVWTFAGVTPFARVGALAELGAFGEIGVHIALPVWRH